MSSARNFEFFGDRHQVSESHRPSEKTDNMVETDIAIIGAGIGGCVAALALAPHYSVNLIDVARSQPSYLGETLPSSAKHILEKLALEDVLVSHQKVQKGLISDWGNESIHTLGCLRDPDGLGWVVNHPLLEQQLRERVVSRGIANLKSLALERSIAGHEQWQLFLSDDHHGHQQILNAKLVIDATGRQAIFAHQQGAHYKQEDRLVSVWMTFRSHSTHEISSVHPSENGWWYCSPIPDSAPSKLSDYSQARNHKKSKGTLMLLSYQTDSDLLDPSLSSSSEALFAAALQIPELASVLSHCIPGSGMHCGIKDVNSSRLMEPEANNWFAVGDAAMSLDPLSSQALFHAMAGAMQLSELILKFGIETEVGKTAISFEFQQQLERIWHQFEAEKLSYYAQERRWCHALFWERRAA